MAETILYNIATEIFKKLGSLALQEMGLMWVVDDELHRLRNTISTIRAVLLDAEDQQMTNHEVEDWLEKLNDVVLDVDDLLDDFSTEALRRKLMMTQNTKWAKKVRIFFSSSNQFAFSLKMGHQIRAIRERLDAIADDRIKFHLTECPVEMGLGCNKREETHSYVCANEVIGRDDDKIAIVKQLFECNAQENVSIVAIVGIGGLGKTALAQLVYNDEEVTKHFELKVWVCVSDVFYVKLIAQKIIESITGKKLENLEMDKVQESLRKELDGKRYLLVLDDVWNEDRERWLRMRDLLIGGAYGSKILLTTRAKLIATVTGTNSPYLLNGLTEDESLALFKRMAFKQGEEPENPRLVAIAKEIVEKCKGVPLAIRALGSLLYSKDTEVEWLYFRENDLPKIAQEENIILPMLKLSYDYLAPSLKRCFAFCSLYPKDHVINRQELIQLWIALGCIQSSDENQHLENVGDLYFMDLLRRSLFQDVERDEWGNIMSCKMHDLIHDLAQCVAETESSMVNLDAEDVTERIRHVSFGSSIDLSWEIPASLLRANRLRTFLLPIQEKNKLNKSVFERIISTFKRLRVLDLHNLGIEMVPGCISKLKHLRYLDLSDNILLRTLPSSFSNLQNLQTLRLSGCRNLEKLPRGIGKLGSLRHLELERCHALTCMPYGLGQLTSLRTLTQFIVDPNFGYQFGGGLSELKALNNLRGDLTIKVRSLLQCTKCTPEEPECLKEKEHLQSLQLSWANDQDAELVSVFQGLQPHPNLKNLFIRSYGCVNFPQWLMVNIGSSLPNLVKIVLSGCHGCKYLPQFGQLPSLEVLKLRGLNSLEYIESSSSCSRGGSDYGSLCSFSSSLQGALMEKTSCSTTETFFLSLKELVLRNLPKLKGWWRPNEAEEPTAAEHHQQLPSLELQTSFPCLSKLLIENCPNLVSLPLHPCVKELVLATVSEKLVKHELSSSLVPLFNLESLRIREINDLFTLPEKAFESLTCLQFLEISFCPRLTSLSGGISHLTALKKLEIDDCKELDLLGDNDGMQFQSLRNLTSLNIRSVSKLVTLPVGLQHVSSLQSLWICGCEDLMTLPEWAANLTSLQRLYISDCPKLTSLSEGMQWLTALRELEIHNCPSLSDRCQ